MKKKMLIVTEASEILMKLLRVRSRLSAINICPSTRLIRQESNDRQPTLSDQVKFIRALQITSNLSLLKSFQM